MNVQPPFRESLKLVALGLTLCLTTSAHAATVLFQETWSGLTAGQSAIDSGRWAIAQGAASQFGIVEFPASSGELYLSPSYPGGGVDVLPMMRTTDSFALDSINELSVTFALTGGGNNGYFRFGIQAAGETDLTDSSYYFHVTSTQILLNRGNASGADTTNVLPAANVSLTNGTYYTLTLQVAPQGGSTYDLKMFLNGAEIMSGTDTAGPSFGESAQIFAGFRDPKLGRVGEITFATVPEPASAALLLTGLALAGATALRRRKA